MNLDITRHLEERKAKKSKVGMAKKSGDILTNWTRIMMQPPSGLLEKLGTRKRYSALRVIRTKTSLLPLDSLITIMGLI
jgi:hypothetical protein